MDYNVIIIIDQNEGKKKETSVDDSISFIFASLLLKALD